MAVTRKPMRQYYQSPIALGLVTTAIVLTVVLMLETASDPVLLVYFTASLLTLGLLAPIFAALFLMRRQEAKK